MFTTNYHIFWCINFQKRYPIYRRDKLNVSVFWVRGHYHLPKLQKYTCNMCMCTILAPPHNNYFNLNQTNGCHTGICLVVHLNSVSTVSWFTWKVCFLSEDVLMNKKAIHHNTTRRLNQQAFMQTPNRSFPWQVMLETLWIAGLR